MRARAFLLLAVVATCGATAALFEASCAQTPANVPIRTFERAQRMDVVCMQVLDPITLQPVPPKPVAQNACAPVAAGVDGNLYVPNHLFALVTQTARGEVAVVDLTGGAVVDSDRSTPGTNFLPVGQIPTDIASTPDGVGTFVASAEVNKAAIYMLPSTRVLGDWCVPEQPCLPESALPPPVALTAWPACALPQAPGAITVVPRAQTASDGGAPSGPGYALVAVLPGDRLTSAKIVTIDPTPFLRGAGIDTSSGPTIAPGSLAACPVLGAVQLAGQAQVDLSSAPIGPAWPDGVTWVDGGVDTSKLVPPTPGTACGSSEPPPSDAGADASADAGADADAGAATSTDAGSLPLPFQDGAAPSAADVVRDGTTLYVADAALPIIHVLDVSTDVPAELAPLLITSMLDPTRTSTARALAVSPATRDYRRYLYAVDAKDGSVIVYDVTDPVNSPHVPLTRPHPEVNPFQPPDRIVFSAPVVAVSFARHDFPASDQTTNQTAAGTGLLCNPNPNAPATDQGVLYRASGSIQQANAGIASAALGPYRLRGIFGFVTLTNGLVVPIDVDDWDAPCRRPDPTSSVGANQSADGGVGGTVVPNYSSINELAPTEPSPTGATDTDPYHAPTADRSNGASVTLENFFPVSAPNRARSFYFLRNDPATQSRAPFVQGAIQITLNGGSLPLTGPGSESTPRMVATDRGGLADPSLLATPTAPGSNYLVEPSPPSLRIAWEDPTAHVDQDWGVTFEGPIPGFVGLSLTMSSDDGNHSLVLSQPQALFCARGVEDYAMGQARAALVTQAAGTSVPLPDNLSQRVGDYVQITDDLLDPSDPYWSNDAAAASVPQLRDSSERYNGCYTTYGPAVNPSIQRDFPVIEAYEDHLVVGRFGYPDPNAQTTATRVIVGPDATNVPFLTLARYCFHDQIGFTIRTGGEWVAVGTQSGYLHHVARGDGGRCVESCAPYLALLNSRQVMIGQPATIVASDRNSALALRNPMFSFSVFDGFALDAASKRQDVTPLRDSTWTFSMRGSFTPLTVNIAATTTAVSPQSMKFVAPLQLLAVVDGSSQGLVLIDLGSVAFAHDPFF